MDKNKLKRLSCFFFTIFIPSEDNSNSTARCLNCQRRMIYFLSFQDKCALRRSGNNNFFFFWAIRISITPRNSINRGVRIENFFLRVP